MPRIVHVVGARPNFVKIAPIMAALRQHDGVDQRLVHTGQHHDRRLADALFEDLGLPAPDHDLRVGSGTHAEQTAAVMVRLEPVLVDERPDLVVVVGDVNSTVAAALVAAKRGLPVAHVEAGLRSFDRSMPEEINRIVTDQLSTILLAPTDDAAANLRGEGRPAAAITVVGNVMIDALLAHRAGLRWPSVDDGLDLGERGYLVLTLHRPANVDDPARLTAILARVADAAADLPVVFPVHPRTGRLLAGGACRIPPGVRPIEPLGYRRFLALMDHAASVITDSGGIQEETTALGVPCFTVRDTTEWPRTVSGGTNTLVGADAVRLAAAMAELRAGRHKRPTAGLEDGRASVRIAGVLARFLGVAPRTSDSLTAV